MSNITDILLLARHVSIVHHIPGRIRLRVLPSGIPIAAGLDLNRLVNGIQGVRKTRVNAIVGSVTVEYDCELLSPQLWESLVKSKSDPMLASQVEKELIALWEH